MPDGSVVEMSPGGHSELIREIIQEFAPRFAQGSSVLYLGDTGQKGVVIDRSSLEALGAPLHERGKMPDVILYCKAKGWLYLIESVTSVGPVDGKRHAELRHHFGNTTAGLVFVTAFPTRRLMARFGASRGRHSFCQHPLRYRVGNRGLVRGQPDPLDPLQR